MVVGKLGGGVLSFAEDRGGCHCCCVDIRARPVHHRMDDDRRRCRLLPLQFHVDGARSRTSAACRRHLDRLPFPVCASADGAQCAPIEEDHEHTRYVEGGHRREDDEVGIVEDAEPRSARASRRVVHTKRDRQGDGDRDDPRER